MLANKFSELNLDLTSTNLYFLKNRFRFIIISRTWLKKDFDFTLEIRVYHSKSLYRSDNGGVGIKIYFFETMSVSVLYVLTSCTNFVKF